MTGSQLVIVFVLGDAVLALALVVDLLNLYVRVKAGNRMRSTAAPAPPAGFPIRFTEVIRAELLDLADEWRNFRGIALVLYRAVAWTDVKLALPAWIRAGFRGGDEAPGWRVLRVVPLLLLWGRAPDYVVAWSAALGYLIAREHPRVVLVAAWVVAALALRSTDLLVTGLVTGAAVTFAIHRRDREAVLTSLCVVAAGYGLLIPALAISVRLLGARSLNVAAWVGIAIPTLAGTSILDTGIAGSDLLTAARDVRGAAVAWLGAVLDRPDPASALRTLLNITSGFSLIGVLLRGYVTFTALLLSVRWAIASLTPAAGDNRILLSTVRAAGTIILGIAAMQLVLPAVGGSGGWVLLTVVVTGMAVTKSGWNAPRRDVEGALRAFVGIGADIAGMLAAVMVGLYIEDFGKDGMTVAADILLALVSALAFVWIGWAEHVKEAAPAGSSESLGEVVAA